MVDEKFSVQSKNVMNFLLNLSFYFGGKTVNKTNLRSNVPNALDCGLNSWNSLRVSRCLCSL